MRAREPRLVRGAAGRRLAHPEGRRLDRPLDPAPFLGDRQGAARLLRRRRAGTLERQTAKTIVDPAALERELQRTRLRGYALIRDELEIGLSAVAAPVFDRAGACVAAVAVSGPSFRLARSLASLGEQCVAAAHELTAAVDTEYVVPAQTIAAD